MISSARLFAATHTARCARAFAQGEAARAAHPVNKATTTVRGTTIQVFLIKNPLRGKFSSAIRSQMNGLTDRCQFEESAKVLDCLDTHDVVLQFFALILADYVAAERGEFCRDFLLGHGIARIAFRYIDTSGM